MAELGVITGKALKALEGQRRGFEDMRMFDAPIECGKLVADGARRELSAILRDAGMTPRGLVQAAESATSPRWVYMSGLGEVVQMFAEPRHARSFGWSDEDIWGSDD